MNSQKHSNILSAAFVCITIIGGCSDSPPAEPPVKPAADTTSHDWDFTVYNLENGLSSYSLRDISAIAPDYAVMVGDAVHGNEIGTNAFLWDGSGLQEMSIPVKSWGTSDSCTVCVPGVYVRHSSFSGIWVLRRDYYWVSSPSVTAHVTVSPSPRNTTNVLHAYAGANVGLRPSRIWGTDRTDVLFLNFFGDGAHLWNPKDRSWKRYDFIFPKRPNENNALDLWGTSSTNVFAFTNNGAVRFDGTQWHSFWNVSMPSLCDSAYFGTPVSAWAAAAEDSMWIVGLFIGRTLKDGSGKVTYRFSGRSDNGYSFGAQCVRGSARNNVFFIGLDGYIAHYNGSTLRVFDQFRNQGIEFYRVAVFDDDVLIVGAQQFGGGVFVHGRRR